MLSGLYSAATALEVAEHGHSHDDGDVEEQNVGHFHGHNAADHSHETPHVPAFTSMIGNTLPDTHLIYAIVQPDLSVRTPLERPPKPVS